jgi:hypothetical protein
MIFFSFFLSFFSDSNLILKSFVFWTQRNVFFFLHQIQIGFLKLCFLNHKHSEAHKLNKRLSFFFCAFVFHFHDAVICNKFN